MRLLITFGLLLIFVWLALRRLEQSSLYYPDHHIYALPTQAGLPYEAVDLLTSDNVRIHGWWIPAYQSEEARRLGGQEVMTVLFCHGNGGNISHRLDKAVRLHRLGVNQFYFDYRGYGESASVPPSEKGTYRDAAAAYLYLTQMRGIDPKRVILYGESLGGAVAVETVLHHPAAGLVLESAFTSTMAMASRIFPWLPTRLIIHNRYDNLRKLPMITIPVLVLHSPKDEVVPFSMGQQNYAAIVAPKRFVELHGGHNEGYAEAGSVYTDAIRAFVKSFQ